jgi:hypothetical protein
LFASACRGSGGLSGWSGFGARLEGRACQIGWSLGFRSSCRGCFHLDPGADQHFWFELPLAPGLAVGALADLVVMGVVAIFLVTDPLYKHTETLVV